LNLKQIICRNSSRLIVFLNTILNSLQWLNIYCSKIRAAILPKKKLKKSDQLADRLIYTPEMN